MQSITLVTPKYSLSAEDLTSWLILIATVICFSLFVFNSVTRTGRFSADSKNYVNVARNIAVGKGITQPTLGFNQPRFSTNDGIPTPLIAQAPLYPLMIALVSRMGISTARSALLLSAVAYGIVFLLVYILAAGLYNQNVALTAAGVLLFYDPLRRMAGYAWTDPIGIAFVLLSLWLLTSECTKRNRWLLLSAGLATGLAFATRYALLPLFGIGVLFLLIDSPTWRRKSTDICLYALGFAIPSGPVWGHNFLVSGSIMPPFTRAGVDFTENVIAAFWAVFESYLGTLPPQSQLGLFGLSSLAICVALMARHHLTYDLRDVFFSNRRYILTLWSLGYLIFLIVERSHWYYGPDRWGEMLRMIVPAGVIMVVLWSALAIRAAKAPSHWIRPFVLVLLLLTIWREAGAAIKRPVLDFQKRIRHSERLTWLLNYTSEQDLIIGDNTIDIPFFLNRGLTLSFSPYPTTDYPTYDKIMVYSQRHCQDYRNIYLVLHSYSGTEKEWRLRYGDFFADLVFGHIENYPGVVPLQQLDDALIFKIRCR